MLKERIVIFARVLMFIDACIALVVYYLSYVYLSAGKMVFFGPYRNLIPIFILVWLFLLKFSGMYESFRVKRVMEILFNIFKMIISGFLIFTSIIYILHLDVSRVFTISSFLLVGIFIAIERIFLAIFLRYVRSKGFNYRNVLIIGTAKRAQNFISLIEKHSEWGLRVIGLVDEEVSKKDEVIMGYRVLGAFDDIEHIIHNNVVDEVVFIVPRSWLNRIEGIMKFLETEGIKIHVGANYFDLELSHAKQTDLCGFPLITFDSTPAKHWQLFIKHIFDITFSAVFLILLFPLFIVIAIIIKLTSEGPVFFRQLRCGLNSRKFILYKFRTMVKNAENKLDELYQYNEMKGPVFKMKDDPRLTKIGKFLRKTSLDELPQLWNVFTGNMSLVGPRPPLPKEVEKYDNWQRRRLSMRPGVTCLWQVNGRNKITNFVEWMKLDLNYIDRWSLRLDFEILLKTIPVVLFGIGAK